MSTTFANATACPGSISPLLTADSRAAVSDWLFLFWTNQPHCGKDLQKSIKIIDMSE
jgi:hypothetical protein